MNKKAFLIVAIAVISFAALLFFSRPKSNLGGGGFDNIFQTSTISSVAKVASTSTTVLAQNSARQFVRCTNMGPARMDIAFGSPASVSWGLALWASQSFTIDQNNLYIGIITARIPNDTASPSARISCIDK